MEDSEYNDMTSLWFNNRLFSLNGDPLKFYLEGYGQTEFHEVVQIIEAYGGELSSPDAPDTFVFCESNHPVSVEKSDRYDIQYFQDSIIALHPQDLMKYKLHQTTVQASTSSTGKNYEPTDSHHNEIHREQKNNSEDGDCIDLCSTDSETMQVRRNSCATIEGRVYADRLEESQIAGPSTSLQIHHQNNNNYDGDPHNSCQRTSEDDGDSHDSTDSQTTDDSRSSQPESNEKDTPVDHSLPLSTNLVKRKKGKGEWRGGRKRTSFTIEENEIIMKWLMEKKVIPSITGQTIWKRFLEEKVLPQLDVSAYTLSEHFRRELKEHPTFVNWIKDMETSGREFEPALKTGRKLTAFTEEETQTMIRWLMEKKFMPSKRGTAIWDCFLKEEVLPHRHITMWTLQEYFERVLKKHPTFVQWIEDMKTSGREFNSPPSKRGSKYSEEENQIMIHHIIDHDAYRRALSVNVWQELLLSSKLPLDPERTAFGLLNHFSSFLLKNYSEYTDDPDALKKFEEIELKRQLRSRNSEKRIDLA